MATEIINQCSIRSKLGLEGGHGAVLWGQDVSLLHPHSAALADPKPVRAWVPVRGAAMGAGPSEPGHSLLAQNCSGLGNDFFVEDGTLGAHAGPCVAILFAISYREVLNKMSFCAFCTK